MRRRRRKEEESPRKVTAEEESWRIKQSENKTRPATAIVPPPESQPCVHVVDLGSRKHTTNTPAKRLWSDLPDTPAICQRILH